MAEGLAAPQINTPEAYQNPLVGEGLTRPPVALSHSTLLMALSKTEGLAEGAKADPLPRAGVKPPLRYHL